MKLFDSIESKAFEYDAKTIREKTSLLNQHFKSQVKATDGYYGVKEIDKGNGVIKKIFKNDAGHSVSEFYRDGKLYKKHEILGDKKNLTVDYDDNGMDYLRTVRQTFDNKSRIVEIHLKPNTTITKGNFTSVTDEFGRPILNRVTDLKISDDKRSDVSKYRNSAYKTNDHSGHLIAHIFGGTSGKENIVAQFDKVNLGLMKKVENIVRELKEQGHKVDYEMRSNYVGANERPSSFEPRIFCDGKEYTNLPEELKKIYNTDKTGTLRRKVTDFGEKLGPSHETSFKSGLLSAGLTLATSTVDNVSAFVNGEITADEMIVDIVKDTGAAGAIEYGSELITGTVSKALSGSSSKLIRKIVGTGLPAAMVSFAVESYDSVSAFAKGEIDGSELAYELGENAASVAGAMGGATLGFAVGTVPGSIVGSIVGAAIATEIYSAAVELCVEGREAVLSKADGYMVDIIELFKDTHPEKVEEVKGAIDEYRESAGLSILNK